MSIQTISRRTVNVPVRLSARPLPARATAALTVDLGAIARNYRQLVAIAGPGCAVGAVVKANAYGLGMAAVAGALARAGCRWFFVATADEAASLEAALPAELHQMRIAVLGGVLPGTARDLAALRRVVPVMNDLEGIELWRAAAPERPLALNIDTGMSRLGLRSADLDGIHCRPALIGGAPIAFVMSHLAAADEPGSTMSTRQRTLFLAAAGLLPEAPLSLAASAGFFLGPQYWFNLVRPGAALYGLNPQPHLPNPMAPVVRLSARILQVATIAAGETVGYDCTFSASGPTRLATLGIGYADGVPRAGSNRASCVIGGIPAPFVGYVSMDLMTIDVSRVPPHMVFPGAWVDLIGPDYDLDAMAADCATTGYEVLTRLGGRLHRQYQDDLDV